MSNSATTSAVRLRITTYSTVPIANRGSLHAKAAQMEGGRAAIAAQQVPLPPAELAEVVMLRGHMLAGLALCTLTVPAQCLSELTAQRQCHLMA